MKAYASGSADEKCEFAEDDTGYCFTHRCYLSDDGHPHVWEYCYAHACPCPEPIGGFDPKP